MKNEKLIKRIFCAVLCAVMVFSLIAAGCSQIDFKKDDNNPTVETNPPETDPTETEEAVVELDKEAAARELWRLLRIGVTDGKAVQEILEGITGNEDPALGFECTFDTITSGDELTDFNGAVRGYVDGFVVKSVAGADTEEGFVAYIFNSEDVNSLKFELRAKLISEEDQERNSRSIMNRDIENYVLFVDMR